MFFVAFLFFSPSFSFYFFFFFVNPLSKCLKKKPSKSNVPLLLTDSVSGSFVARLRKMRAAVVASCCASLESSSAKALAAAGKTYYSRGAYASTSQLTILHFVAHLRPAPPPRPPLSSFSIGSRVSLSVLFF